MNARVERAVAEAGDHPIIEKGARAGYAASALLHLVLAWIILQIALGQSSQEADQSGALSTLSSNPLGGVLLWTIVAAFALLALWQISEAIVRGETKDRLKAAGKAVTYLVLGWTAIGVVTGSGSSGDEGGMTATLMAQPFGRFLVAAVGLGVLVVAGYHVYKGWTKKFLEDLREHPGKWIVYAGRIGYVLKGVALATIGVLLLVAAATADPERAEGLDGALRSLQALPYGPVLLTVVGLGFAAYGVYSFGRAKYARV